MDLGLGPTKTFAGGCIGFLAALIRASVETDAGTWDAGARGGSMLQTYMRAKIALAMEEGQALVEYALIISLIAIAAILALTFLSGQINGIFSTIGSGL
jgi:Flp pilus assembly pilin Flp